MLRLFVCLGVSAAATTAAAEQRTGVVTVPAQPTALEAVPKTIFLNRCAGGCVVHAGIADDARTNTSTVVTGGATFNVSAFQWSDPEWNQLVACLKEVFSPYAVTLTDVEPAQTEHYGEAIIAGLPVEVGISPEFGGFAPYAANCGVVDRAMSFTFANVFVNGPRVLDMCWIAAQEIGHTYGLDHQYQLANGMSACHDPMTYRTDCGGQKFFRTGQAICGEESPRMCRCGQVQTTHALLSARLGSAIPTTSTTVSFTSPTDGATIAENATLHVLASAQRGVARVEVFLNGYRWFERAGAAFGPTGQPATDYTFALPSDVPDGVIDIEAVAFDDLGVKQTAVVTVTKGSPCTSADSCAKGQLCEDGRCFWEPPSGLIGDRCEYPQFCESGRCDTVDGDSFCTTSCPPALDTICGEGNECRQDSGSDGYCWPIDAGGCCSATGEPPWLAFGFVLYVLLRRRATATRSSGS